MYITDQFIKLIYFKGLRIEFTKRVVFFCERGSITFPKFLYQTDICICIYLIWNAVRTIFRRQITLSVRPSAFSSLCASRSACFIASIAPRSNSCSASKQEKTKQTLILKNIKYKEYVVPTRSRWLTNYLLSTCQVMYLLPLDAWLW